MLCFKVINEGPDSLHPDLEAVLAALYHFEWVGLTDLFEPSLCLLHYQANRTLPRSCDCTDPSRLDGPPLGHWVETRSQRRDASELPERVLAQLDAQTAVDAALFAAALRLVLGRLRRVEELTAVSLLPCIDWETLWRTTAYVPGLWEGAEGLLHDT